MENFNSLVVVYGKYLKDILPFYAVQILKNNIVCVVNPKHLLFVLFFLRDHSNCQYKVLTSITATDYPQIFHRFELSYELLSLRFNTRLRIKTFVNSSCFVKSATLVFNSANWWEREIWDLFGVFFLAHPDLRRLLTDYGFEGHALRKDFPICGYSEVRYDDTVKRVICEPLEMAAEFRSFNFESSWSKNINQISNFSYKIL